MRDPLLRMTDPMYANSRVPQKFPVDWILKNLVYSVDFDDMRHPNAIACMVEEKASDEGFGNLVESIMENGHLEGGPIGLEWDDHYGGIYINEGHHRLVAAILLCLDEVWASPYSRDTLVNGRDISGFFADNGDRNPIYVDH